MNPSLADNPPVRTAGHWRLDLARKWAYVLASTACLPLSHTELEHRLLALVGKLAGRLTAGEPGAGRAAEIGAQLVELECVGKDSLRRTLDVLGRDLLSAPELGEVPRLAERVVAMLGEVAAGYSEALRVSVFQQQETVHNAVVDVLRQTTRKLAESEERFAELCRLSAGGVAITDLDGRVLWASGALCRIVGRQLDELLGRELPDLFEPGEIPGLRAAYEKLAEGRFSSFRRRRCALRRDDDPALVSLSVSLLRDDEPDKLLTIVADETELSLLQERLAHQSLHDVATRLPNRQFFTTTLEKALRRADPEFGVTLYHLDLDAFSVVTDGLDGKAGDLLLREVAARLGEVFAGEQATLARLGADEFGVVVRNSATTPNFVTMIGRINEALTEPRFVGDDGVAVSACIGVVDRPPLSIQPEELLRASRITLRRARSVGRRQWALYDPAEYARDRETDRLAASMPGAWENGEIRVVYRPVVWLPGSRTAGVEAQFRWDHPELGALPHQRCVALAERTGLILTLGAWAMRIACEEIAGWADVPVALSLSKSQAADPDLAATVLAALEGIGLPGKRFLLAMPLNELIAEHGEAAESLKVLADIGVTAAVDDFDGGPADLAYLEHLPVQAVRLTRRLVTAQAGGLSYPVERSLAALVDCVQATGRRVAVEGIETTEQAEWWGEAGVDLAAGPMFGTGDDLATLLGPKAS